MRSANKTAMTKPRNRTFLAAINSNDGARVRQLIAEGADIHARFGPAMLPPALHAASEGHAESLRAILASRTGAGGGVDVDEADCFGQTALSLAAVRGRAECVRALAEAGADLGKSDDRGMAPIHYAAYKGALACLQALLAAGADADQADSEGSTPAIFACKTGQAGSLRVLMAAGADLKLADAFGMAPSDHADRAAALGEPGCASMILAHQLLEDARAVGRKEERTGEWTEERGEARMELARERRSAIDSIGLVGAPAPRGRPLSL